MTIRLAPLSKSEPERVMHLELGEDQDDFVGRIEDMVSTGNPAEDFHVIQHGDAVVGFFKIDHGYPANYAFARRREIGVRGVLIDRKVQGKGIGSKAMAALPDYARVNYPDAAALVLTVNCNNPAARRTYEKAGFVAEAELYYGGRAGPQHILRFPLD